MHLSDLSSSTVIGRGEATFRDPPDLTPYIPFSVPALATCVHGPQSATVSAGHHQCVTGGRQDPPTTVIKVLTRQSTLHPQPSSRGVTKHKQSDASLNSTATTWIKTTLATMLSNNQQSKVSLTELQMAHSSAACWPCFAALRAKQRPK